MKTLCISLILSIVCQFASLNAFAQNNEVNDIEGVDKAIGKYLEGSSYSKLKLLESAFSEDATLYLTAKGGFQVFTPKEYVAFFENREPNKFNGRFGKLLAIDVYGDIATAKAEIRIPERDMYFIDLFLLKKKQNEWVIISKTATQL